MSSTVAWLDTSAEEQRRVREVLSLFAQSESRDELGIGQVRDAFSELLFPGTSVLQTRARYFLVVPWLYRVGSTRRSGPALVAWVEGRERRLIEVMRNDGDTEGLIGRLAGPNVKLLPSTIYWSGLVRYGILHRDIGQHRLGSAPSVTEADELAERVHAGWHPTLPQPPEGFPESLAGGFSLTRTEASWLAERMRATAPDRLLAHVLTTDVPVAPDSYGPWDDPVTQGAPAAAAEVLHQAELFSLGMHGAALLYNLLLGEAYQEAGLTRIQAPVDEYRDWLTEWSDLCQAAAGRLTVWDRDRMWEIIRTANPRIGVTTRAFVDLWLDAVATGKATAASGDERLRSLVRNRELQQKRGQARLANRNLLTTWSGASGTARLAYRWGTVRQLVADIQEGVAGAVA